MKSIKVLFFRGLNTYNTDRLQIGPIDFGPAHVHLKQMLEDKEVELIPILEFGCGSLECQVQKAIEYSLKHNLIQKEPVHLLGHSTGGLIARGFAHYHPHNDLILSVTSMATPHKGTQAAEKALNMNTNNKVKHKLLKKLGYDTNIRKESYLALTPLNCARFNKENSLPEHIKKASLTFTVPHSEMSTPLFLSHRVMNGFKKVNDTDGLVELESQRWGQHIGHFKLDHLSQLGFNFYTKKQKRRRLSAVFKQMGDELVSFWQAQEKFVKKAS